MTVFISVDVETNGPYPGKNSMLQLGAIAYDEFGNELSEFTVNLEELPGSQPNPKTMEWWLQFPKIYEETRREPKNPVLAMNMFVEWYSQFNSVIFVAFPASFDWPWVAFYIGMASDPPAQIPRCLDMKSFAAAKLGVEFWYTSKKHFPQEWKRNLPKHTHRALDDAREQGVLFFKMKKHGEPQ